MQERPTAAIKHDRRARLPVAQWYRVLRVKAGTGRLPRRSHCSLPGCTRKKSATTRAGI